MFCRLTWRLTKQNKLLRWCRNNEKLQRTITRESSGEFIALIKFKVYVRKIKVLGGAGNVYHSPEALCNCAQSRSRIINFA